MPLLYLSPSTQEGNLFVSGGSEEEYMNRIADAMVPYLRASGVSYTRNTPEMTAASSIRASNAGNYALHLAIHSNAAPEGRYGAVRGSDVYYFPGSTAGRRAAEIFVRNLKVIYPRPELVRALPTTTIGEVSRTRAPGILLELAYHDNAEDAAWIKNNIGEIARTLALSVTEYLGLPFLPPGPVRAGTVTLESGYLNIRERPAADAPVAARAYNGAALRVLNEWNGWDVVEFDGVTGFARADYIR